MQFKNIVQILVSLFLLLVGEVQKAIDKVHVYTCTYAPVDMH
jgi:hypothetical protein